MEIEEFIETSYTTCNERVRSQIKTFLNLLQVRLGQRDVKEALKDKEFVAGLFTGAHATVPSLSHSNYHRVKFLIQKTAEYYEIEPAIPDWEYLMERAQMVGFYKNLEDIFQHIDDVGVACLKEIYNPRRDLIQIKAICLLCWYGYKLEDIAKITRYDIEDFISKNRFTCESNEILRILSNLEGYVSLQSFGSTRVKQMYFKGDQSYLFRLVRIPGDKTNVVASDLTEIIKRFNARVPEDVDTVIILPKLKRNALYSYLYYLDKSDVETDKLAIIQGYLKCDLVTAFVYQREYKVWKKVLFNQ